jgi:uncharacterized protein (UPF0303 family)
MNFNEFTHAQALEMGLEAVRLVKERQWRRIGVRIILHDVLVFQYLMDGKNEDNYLQGKINVVKETGLSSDEVFNRSAEFEQFLDKAEYCVSGGAVPIIVKGEVYGVIAISGMTQEKDHELAMEVLKNAYDRVKA